MEVYTLLSCWRVCYSPSTTGEKNIEDNEDTMNLKIKPTSYRTNSERISVPNDAILCLYILIPSIRRRFVSVEINILGLAKEVAQLRG